MEFKIVYLARRNPSIAPEDWPRTWRSHAVFASQFPVIGTQISSLYYCNRVREPALNGALLQLPGVARDYDGVAVVSGPSANGFGDRDLSPEDRAKIDQDELRVFSTTTPNFAFHCKEVLVEGGRAGRAAVIRFLTRKAGTPREKFLAHWSETHAAIGKRAAEAGAVLRYVHNDLTKSPPPNYPFDGISEIWFTNGDEAVRSLLDGAAAGLGNDLRAFCDMDRTVTMLTSVIHRWPRA